MSSDGTREFDATNGLFRYKDSNAIYCSICPTDARIDAWEKHIVDPTHVQTLEQFNQVFERKKTRSRCRLCNEDFDWGVLKHHARLHMILPWHRPYEEHEKYKIFFDNRIIEWQSRFHCCICDLTFSTYDVAFVHIADRAHQDRKAEIVLSVHEFRDDALTYDFLVSECLIASTETALECRICGSTKVNVENVSRHVKGLMHKSNRSKFRLEFDERKAQELVQQFNNNFQSEEFPVVDLVPKESASDDSPLEESTPKKVETGTATADRKIVRQSSECNYILKRNSTDSYCTICNCVFFHHSTSNHIRDKDHVRALKAYGCDEISLNNGSDYYCRICNRKMSGPSNVYDHILGSKHLKSLKISRQKQPLMMSNEVRAMKQPKEDIKEVSKLNGNHDAESREKRHVYITPLKDNGFYCRCCNVTVPGPENLYLHLKGKKHSRLCSLSEKQRVRIRPHNFESSTKSNVNFDAIEDGLPSLPDTFGKQQIETGSLEAPKRLNRNLVGTEERLLSLPSTSGRPQTQVESNHESSEITDVNSTGEYTFGLQQHRMSRNRFETPAGREVVFHAKDERYSDLSTETGKWQGQGASLLTVLRRPKHHPEQIIGSLKIPRVNSQIKEEHHSPSDNTLVSPQVRIHRVSSETPKRPKVVFHASDERRSDSPNDSDERQARKANPLVIPRRPRHVPERILESSTCHYLVRVNDAYFRCEVCDCILTGSTSNINIHVTGNYHTASLKRYGCEYIIRRGGNVYHCKCCDVVIDNLEHVHLHIKKDSHIKFVTGINCQQLQLPSNEEISERVEMPERIPDRSEVARESARPTSPSVYILKMNNISHCELCDINLVGSSETLDHVAGADHAAAMEKHGCDSVVLIGGDDYYCKSCKCNISGPENINLHIKGRRHFFGLRQLSDRQQLQTAKRNLIRLTTLDEPDSNTALSTVTTEMSKMVKKLRILERKSRRNRMTLAQMIVPAAAI